MQKLNVSQQLLFANSEDSNFGIPAAEFIENPEQYISEHGLANYADASQAVRQLYQKYKMIERQILVRKMRLLQQVPDIKKTLDVVKHLKSNRGKSFETTFEVGPHLWGFATVPATEKVGLWLGANVMLEYSLEEAEEVLIKNEKSAEDFIAQLDAQLEFLRDQTTTTEVNISRFHNLAVKHRQVQGSSSANAVKAN